MLHKPYSTKTLIGAGTYNGLRTLFATAARQPAASDPRTCGTEGLT